MITSEVAAAIETNINGLGCKLWGVEYTTSGKYSVLRVYIDNDKGITVDDCIVVSEQISAILDVENLISTKYTLEVSSPGVERRLFKVEHYCKFLGHKINLTLFRSINNKRKFTGIIKQIQDNNVILSTLSGDEIISIELINKANLVANF